MNRACRANVGAQISGTHANAGATAAVRYAAANVSGHAGVTTATVAANCDCTLDQIWRDGLIASLNDKMSNVSINVP